MLPEDDSGDGAPHDVIGGFSFISASTLEEVEIAPLTRSAPSTDRFRKTHAKLTSAGSATAAASEDATPTTVHVNTRKRPSAGAVSGTAAFSPVGSAGVPLASTKSASQQQHVSPAQKSSAAGHPDGGALESVIAPTTDKVRQARPHPRAEGKESDMMERTEMTQESLKTQSSAKKERKLPFVPQVTLTKHSLDAGEARDGKKPRQHPHQPQASRLHADDGRQPLYQSQQQQQLRQTQMTVPALPLTSQKPAVSTAESNTERAAEKSIKHPGSEGSKPQGFVPSLHWLRNLSMVSRAALAFSTTGLAAHKSENKALLSNAFLHVRIAWQIYYDGCAASARPVVAPAVSKESEQSTLSKKLPIRAGSVWTAAKRSPAEHTSSPSGKSSGNVDGAGAATSL